jgi:hypothetical protein
LELLNLNIVNCHVRMCFQIKQIGWYYVIPFYNISKIGVFNVREITSFILFFKLGFSKLAFVSTILNWNNLNLPWSYQIFQPNKIYYTIYDYKKVNFIFFAQLQNSWHPLAVFGIIYSFRFLSKIHQLFVFILFLSFLFCISHLRFASF